MLATLLKTATIARRVGKYKRATRAPPYMLNKAGFGEFTFFQTQLDRNNSGRRQKPEYLNISTHHYVPPVSSEAAPLLATLKIKSFAALFVFIRQLVCFWACFQTKIYYFVAI